MSALVMWMKKYPKFDSRFRLVQNQTKMDQKKIFFYFCYLIQLDHKKW
jgi:hypothetical protein